MKKPAKKPAKKLAIRDVTSKKTAAVKGGFTMPRIGTKPVKQPGNKCLPLCTTAPYNSDASVYAGFYGA